jgi:2-polyprenyl-6-methoxyphenol hydroxylase-like FAD-dependent oxidoreductase
MRITCVGGGPAGLYFAISMKLRDAGHDITVLERDPRGATYGWGVVYWDDLLDMLYRNDAESAQKVRAASVVWQEQEVNLRDEESAFLGGYGFSVNRAALLDILTDRASELGVDVRHQHEFAGGADLTADLVVAADGANSRVRLAHADHFGTRLDLGHNPYIWLGTDRVFDRFMFAFEETSAGWIWFHAYPSSAGTSTCIVECTEATWRALGFDTLSNEDGLRLLEKIFARQLAGHSLISQSRGRPAEWLRFGEVRNQTWCHDNVVLVGDAAHTTHFTLGSGTRLAMIDAVMLAQSLYEHADLTAALRDYDRRGRDELRLVQAASRTSMAWFERADHYLDRDAVAFCFAMSGRCGQQAPWTYQLHRASQRPGVRRLQRGLSAGRRWFLARRRGEPVAPRSLLEPGYVAGPAAHDRRFTAGEVDDRGRLGAAGSRVDHGVQHVVEPLLDLPALGQRLVLLGQQQGAGQQRLAEFGQQRLGDGVVGNAHADRLLLRVHQPAGHFPGGRQDEGVAARGGRLDRPEHRVVDVHELS